MTYVLVAVVILLLVTGVVAWQLTRKRSAPAVVTPTYDGPIGSYTGARTLLVAVYAPWASVWRATAQALSQADPSRYDIKLIDADKDRQAVRDFGVDIIPAVIAFRDGRELARLPNMLSLDQLP